MVLVHKDAVQQHLAFILSQLSELQHRLPNKPRVSGSSIAKALDRPIIRMKKQEDAPVERNQPRTKQLRLEYALRNDGVDQRKLTLMGLVRQVAGSRG